jgi:hypothetical protein
VDAGVQEGGACMQRCTEEVQCGRVSMASACAHQKEKAHPEDCALPRVTLHGGPPGRLPSTLAIRLAEVLAAAAGTGRWRIDGGATGGASMRTTTSEAARQRGSDSDAAKAEKRFKTRNANAQRVQSAASGTGATPAYQHKHHAHGSCFAHTLHAGGWRSRHGSSFAVPTCAPGPA